MFETLSSFLLGDLFRRRNRKKFLVLELTRILIDAKSLSMIIQPSSGFVTFGQNIFLDQR